MKEENIRLIEKEESQILCLKERHKIEEFTMDNHDQKRIRLDKYKRKKVLKIEMYSRFVKYAQYWDSNRKYKK